MRVAGLVMCAALALSGCVAVTRSASYGAAHASTVMLDDGRTYLVIPHPRDDTLLLRRPLGTGMGQAFVRGVTLHIAQPGEAYDPWKRAAEMFVEPLGCSVKDVYSLGGDTGAWEARYTCPPGVDLRARLAQRRGQSMPDIPRP